MRAHTSDASATLGGISHPADGQPAASALIAVDVATAALRRSIPVVVAGGAGDVALALALDAAPPHAVEVLQELGAAAPHLVCNAPGALAGHGAVQAPALQADGNVEGGRMPSGVRLQAAAGEFPCTTRPPTSASDAAALKLAKLAGLLPRLLSAPLPPDVRDASAWAAERHLPMVRAEDVSAYQDRAARSLRPVSEAVVPVSGVASTTRIVAFRPSTGGLEHLAIIVGTPCKDTPALVRLHSACLTGDLLGSLRCDCGDQLRGAIAAMDEASGGILLYLAQEGRGIGLVNKLRAYQLQDQGLDTIDANEELGFDADERTYQPAAEMLRQLGFTRVRLMTNNPDKVAALGRYGVEIVERVPHAFEANPHNEGYLRTKALRAGHHLVVA